MLVVVLDRLEKIDASIKAIGERNTPASSDRFQQAQFTGLIKKLDEVARAVQNAKPEVKARVDFGEMIGVIRNIRIPEQKPIDFSRLEKKLDQLLTEAKTDKQTGLTEKLDSLLDAVRAIKFVFPKEWKIEEQQFRQLRSGGGSTTVVAGGGAGRMNATIVTQANTALTANAEATYVFPSNTVNFVIKLRAQNAKLFYAWATGTLPTSGTGALYFTAPQGFIRGQENVEFSGRTIYIQSDVTTTAEIEVFRL